MSTIAQTGGICTQKGKVGYGFILLYTLAFFGLWLALLTPVIISIALRIEALDPANKEANLSFVLGIGAIAAMVINPIAGYFSDRTKGAFGKRRPWMIAGSLVALVGIYMMAVGDLTTLFIGLLITQAGYNAVLAAITAVLPDQVPEEQRGLVSGILGICLPVAVLAGIKLTEMANGDVFNMFMWPGYVALATVILFCFVLKDDVLVPGAMPKQSFVDFVKGFWISPRIAPDFTWAFVSRFMVFIGIAVLITYQVYYMIDVLKIAPDDIPGYMVTATLWTTVTTVVGSLLAGWASDFFNRRKIFVWLSAVLCAVSLVQIGYATTFEAFLWGMAINGLGQGIYLAVDLALVTDVLPNPDDAAKDLGIFNIASAMPQSLAPAVAPAILAIGAVSGESNYSALFLASGIFSILGAIAVFMIKKAR